MGEATKALICKDPKLERLLKLAKAHCSLGTEDARSPWDTRPLPSFLWQRKKPL